MPLRARVDQRAMAVTGYSSPSDCLISYPGHPFIGIMVRVFANGPGDLGSIPDRVIPDSKNGT